jgi:hypothetical protein
MLNKDYQKDIDNVISILKKICLDRDISCKYEDPYFVMEISEFKRKGCLYQRFIVKITTSSDKYILTLYHNGFNDTKFSIDLPLYLNINFLLPYLVEMYIDNIILHRKKVLEIRYLLDSYQDFCNKIKSPEYIRELKINEILC